MYMYIYIYKYSPPSSPLPTYCTSLCFCTGCMTPLMSQCANHVPLMFHGASGIIQPKKEQ